MDEVARFLADSVMCKDFDADEVAKVAAICKSIRFKSGDVIVAEDARGRDLYFIKSGRAQINLSGPSSRDDAGAISKIVPGQVFGATVESILPAISQGQVTVSGMAIDATTLSAEPFIIRLKLDDPKLADKLNAGAYGQAAVYTPSMQATHVIRQVMMRMQAWMNYLVPV